MPYWMSRAKSVWSSWNIFACNVHCLDECHQSTCSQLYKIYLSVRWATWRWKHSKAILPRRIKPKQKTKKPPQKQLRKAVATACCEIFFVRRFIDLCLPHVRPHKLRACNKHGGQFRSSFVKPNYNIEISLL